ncbi:MAG: DUF262 domain-containing HNH endonuclease family protein [Bacteroidota bacterium]|nr:DUF262 domain-containing HNH endonuclease family protein [Bacteroidota bacterium]
MSEAFWYKIAEEGANCMTKIESKVRLIADVLGSGRLQVPWHQRKYDWRVNQVRDLLGDLKESCEAGKECYFIGSIMLVPKLSGEVMIVNDGQQRLITLSLLLAALCRRFAHSQPRDQQRAVRALCALFVIAGHEFPTLGESTKYRPRIKTPRTDQSKYNQLIRGRDIGSNGLLTSAWQKIDEFVEAMPKENRGYFFDFIMGSVEVSVLSVPEGVDANMVFETLNARGKPLDAVDLIRNHLYSYYTGADHKQHQETVHHNLEGIGPILRMSKKVPEYFRCYLQCQFGFLPKNSLYREFRRALRQAVGKNDLSMYVYELVEGLGRGDCIELYRAIIAAKPSDVLEQHLPRFHGKRRLRDLLTELKGYKVSHPVCFALLYRFICERDPAQKRKAGQRIARSMKNLNSFIMRSTFITRTLRPSSFEGALADCAAKVFNGTTLDSLDIMDQLENCDDSNVINDASFVRHMTNVEFKDGKKPRLYLFGINLQSQRGATALRLDECSVEHILPKAEQHWQEWCEFSHPREWVNRAGNLVLLARDENRADRKFNSSFDEKKRGLADSSVQMARSVAEEYTSWTPEIVQKRSEKLAREAARIWKFRPTK